MLNLKYLNICAGVLGLTAAIIGGTILFRGASAKSLFTGSCLFSGGSLVVVTSLYRRQIDKEIELDIDQILEKRRKAVPKTCRGCKNYHGVKYGGVMLVCAIHTNGVDGDYCPDFESFSQKGGTKWK
ncbi:hypothetical protein [Halotia branconii]|uniref:Uncharacterized protein n=1 Tax=Halotia branconii CENA392 TaxID=1539056 RepID=A0AAJ6NYP6_9CYAN|nr:hypothetical protein [Halotia branconii]WGV29200.1 hypothetical protein QI031_30835 [Halotia branconii CENA392]